MERLTYWNEEYGCWSYHCGSGEAANRLAAYEETGGWWCRRARREIRCMRLQVEKP